MRYELWEICDFDEFAVQAMILNKSFEIRLHVKTTIQKSDRS